MRLPATGLSLFPVHSSARWGRGTKSRGGRMLPGASRGSPSGTQHPCPWGTPPHRQPLLRKPRGLKMGGIRQAGVPSHTGGDREGWHRLKSQTPGCQGSSAAQPRGEAVGGASHRDGGHQAARFYSAKPPLLHPRGGSVPGTLLRQTVGPPLGREAHGQHKMPGTRPKEHFPTVT